MAHRPMTRNFGLARELAAAVRQLDRGVRRELASETNPYFRESLIEQIETYEGRPRRE